jgi:hypothetical protein
VVIREGGENGEPTKEVPVTIKVSNWLLSTLKEKHSSNAKKSSLVSALHKGCVNKDRHGCFCFYNVFRFCFWFWFTSVPVPGFPLVTLARHVTIKHSSIILSFDNPLISFLLL